MPIELRAFEMSDAPAVHRMFNTPQLVGRRYIEDDGSPLSQQQVDDLVGKWAGDNSNLAIVDGEDLLGRAVLDAGWDPLAPFVAVVIDPDRQRKGRGTKALRMLLDHLFNTTPALGAMTWVDQWNSSGLAFAEACGFTEVGRARREGIREGKYFASVALDLLREEWEAGRGD
jgi:RimJ/RimL family protein N-acetyltransferase